MCVFIVGMNVAFSWVFFHRVPEVLLLFLIGLKYYFYFILNIIILRVPSRHVYLRNWGVGTSVISTWSPVECLFRDNTGGGSKRRRGFLRGGCSLFLIPHFARFGSVLFINRMCDFDSPLHMLLWS